MSFFHLTKTASTAHITDEMDQVLYGGIKSDAEIRQEKRSGATLLKLFRNSVKMVIFINELERRRQATSMNLQGAPEWPPEHDFSFPITQMRPQTLPDMNIKLSDLTEKKHLCDGSNANVYLAKYKNEMVIIKQIKKNVKNDDIAVHEFDMELGLLCRLSHSSLIKLLGAGTDDDGRKFLVLQYLGGGTLKEKYDRNIVKNNKKCFAFMQKKSFTLPEALVCARELAVALNYLHNEANSNATFIHRDLKPDNIAFLPNGKLILFDLGLCTVIKKSTNIHEGYQMTGGTGSLRYMAPEVALEQPYNEKADLYSYAIIIWQMATDETPYFGASKASYIKYACKLGERPTLVSSWPKEFKELLAACWHQDFTKRPAFPQVIETLDKLIAKYPVVVKKKK